MGIDKSIHEENDKILIMIKTIRAHYTGSVFEPIDKIDLKDGTDVILSIIINENNKIDDIWSVLDRYTGIIEGPPDWSSEHNKYSVSE